MQWRWNILCCFPVNHIIVCKMKSEVHFHFKRELGTTKHAGESTKPAPHLTTTPTCTVCVAHYTSTWSTQIQVICMPITPDSAVLTQYHTSAMHMVHKNRACIPHKIKHAQCGAHTWTQWLQFEPLGNASLVLSLHLQKERTKRHEGRDEVSF